MIEPASIAPAYAFRAYAQTQRVNATSPTTTSADVSANNPGRSQVARTLVAAVVPGKVDFVVDEHGRTLAMPTSAIPLYRHPADKNAAATGVLAGRALDVRG